MKKTMRFLSMAALALVGAVMTGCSSDDNYIEQQPENKSKVVTLTTTVGLDGGATTRALTSGGVKTFAVGETMALVYKKTGGATAVAVSDALKDDGDITNNGKTATFSVTLEDPDKTQNVTYVYPAAMANSDGSINYAALNSQNGTLAALSSSLDLATSPATAWNGNNLPAVTLENQLAILALTLKDNATPTANDITSSITGVTVSDGTNTYTVTRSAAAGPIYVAIKPTSSAAISVTATGGTTNYTKSLTGKTYAAGNGYNVSWRMDPAAADPLAVPLTLEALSDGTIVVNIVYPFGARRYDFPDDYPESSKRAPGRRGSSNISMKYSVNGGEKQAVTSDAIAVSAGDKVQLYGNGPDLSNYGVPNIAGGDAQVKAYGNIMSMLDEDNYATLTTLQDIAFYGLFAGYTTLTDASGLLLPATTLATWCYGGMFYGCESLTAAPELPATTLAEGCYTRMFAGCESLTAAPALPATELANNCYEGMFYGCTSLTTAPTLPATTLAGGCYSGMFDGCTSLTTAPALPAETLANSCYSEMFYGCTSLTTAPALPATTLAESCYNSMFSDCTSLNTAPALPSTTLVEGCYSYMFMGCTSLNSITCLATEGINENESTENWLQGVASTGTFTKASGATSWPEGANGIPSGWTVNEQ